FVVGSDGRRLARACALLLGAAAAWAAESYESDLNVARPAVLSVTPAPPPVRDGGPRPLVWIPLRRPAVHPPPTRPLPRRRPARAPVPPPRPPVRDGGARRLVWILVDGLRLDTSRTMPVLNRLRAEGVDVVAHAEFPSFSGPNFVAQTSGLEPAVAGVLSN